MITTSTTWTSGPSCYDRRHDLAVYRGTTLRKLRPRKAVRLTSDVDDLYGSATLKMRVRAGRRFAIAVDAPGHTREVDVTFSATGSRGSRTDATAHRRGPDRSIVRGPPR